MTLLVRERHALVEATSFDAEMLEAEPQESVRVMLDPEGHPFCQFPDEI